VHDVVLALAFGEVHPRHPLIAGEVAHRGAERVCDLSQQRGRGDRQAQPALDVAEQTAGVLQLRHVDVAVHPVEALHLGHHVISEDTGDAARYGHSWAPVGRAASRPTKRFERFIHRTGTPVTVSAPTGALPPSRPRHGSSGWGGSPVSLVDKAHSRVVVYPIVHRDRGAQWQRAHTHRRSGEPEAFSHWS